MFKFFIFSWTDGAVTTPTDAGLEYTLPKKQMGWVLPKTNGGYALVNKKLHYKLKGNR